MKIPSKRSDYSLLSQHQDDQINPKFVAGGGGIGFGGGGGGLYYESSQSDWEMIDQRMIHPAAPNRVGTGSGLQRQSSGSSFTESTISGDFYTNSITIGGESRPTMREGGGGGGGGSSSSKSWAQQTEESYQLQLALALRLSTEATCADDPNFLDPVPDETTLRSSSSASSADSMSHRFWVNGSLSYSDKIPDGFYLIYGMDPYIWTISNDLQENGRIPSIESLKVVDPTVVSSVEVILIDRHSDPTLKELQNRAHNMSSSCITTKEVVEQLANLVSHIMGGAASSGEDELVSIWKECSDDQKDCLGSIVLPIGSLSIGLCRHRALLFKVLADIIDLPCRIAKGCKYCTRADASSCLVRFGLDREYLVDLICKPGCLCEPDSMLNGPSSISISSPLRFPRFRQVEPLVDFRSLALQYFSDSQSLNIVFDDSSTGIDGDGGDNNFKDLNNNVAGPSNKDETSLLPKEAHIPREYDRPNILNAANVPRETIGQPDIRQLVAVSDPRVVPTSDLRLLEDRAAFIAKCSEEFNFGIEALDIPWSDLVLREKIGAGSFGTVHRAEWNGCDVAVKILMEQDFHAERFKEFLREVAIMKRLRHPNIVLFMGAVTQPPNLSIVTEYLSRGSLYRLMHKPGAREVLDERRRLCMAYDVAKGMNYLHKCNPPVVHRDLKSPNLLVDKKYTVKVCDFGLSRLKANTFLSSKSAAGTPEWMAPEVLRDEQSNEKSDVYSFGIILWELATLQQPWSNLNPAQVVAAVGFKGKRLDIPRDVNPQLAALIEICWANEPWKRPSFSTIMDILRPLTKAPATPQSNYADLP
ncbi:non-receptor serine/threonine protein kinase [Lithospermum erythrorhizon]|uniref:non-specific serine/threonine protein kinase n=1 Tax=Lithospermum erythrorhizon TaxID=34254 RepID=A0AAV3R3P5_LITER